MKVFKFGGASVNSVERIVKLGDILKKFPKEKILVVISAMGKTTNALEKVVDAFYNNKKEEALQLFELVKKIISQQQSNCWQPDTYDANSN